MKRVFDTQSMQLMALFERITHAPLHDLIQEGEMITFVVEENHMGKAIGKGGRNSQRLEKALKRRVKIVEYSGEVITFVKNLFYPLKTAEAIVDEGVVHITPADIKTRGRMIGRNAQTLRRVENIVKRYHDIKEIKIEQPPQTATQE